VNAMGPSEVAVEPVSSPASKGYRWLVCALLFLVTMNNYMDRQLLSIVAPTITTEFHLSASDLALIINAFLLAYGVGQLFSGRFMDWIGPRKGFTLSVLVWSMASVCTSLARTVMGFAFFRLLLGVSESGNFSGGVKVISQLFPPQERTMAVGFFASGVSVGALLTPPVTAYLIVHYGWQFAFVFVGAPGFLWLVAWLSLYEPAASSSELSELNPSFNTTISQVPENTRSWSFLLRHRVVWGLILGRVIEEPAGWFFFSWLPLYLKTFRDLTLINIGWLLTIPFLMLDMGFLVGGWAASFLIRRGHSIDHVRRVTMIGSAICMLSSIPAIMAPTPLGFVVLISLATFGHGCWSSNIMAMPGDILPHTSVGTLYGLAACCGSAGSIVFMLIVGRLIDTQHSFTSPFVIAGLLPLIGVIFTFAVAGKIRRLPSLATSEV
jgi:MFS transporter, ACS family, hexuronate transporter